MRPVPSLRRQADWRRTLEQGSKARWGAVSATVLQRGDAEPTRLGLAVAKSTGGAVRRNRARRRLKAVVGGLRSAPGQDVILRAGPEVATEEFENLVEGVAGALKRAGLRTSPGPQSIAGDE